MTLTPEILKQLAQVAHSVTLDAQGHILSVVFNAPSSPAPVPTPKRRVVVKAESRRIVRKSVMR